MVAKRPRLGGRGVPTPHVLFMTAAGELLGTVSNYASPDQVLAAMRKMLKENTKYDKLSEPETKITDPVAKAELHIDLVQYDKARKVLAEAEGAKAHYLLGRLARQRGDWDEMEAQFKQVDDETLADDVKMERAYRHWHAKAYDKLAAHLKGFEKTSNRYSEARYHEGLALHLQGKKKDALALWKSTITGCSQDRWIYRADWAYCNLMRGNRGGGFSSMGKRNSCLNRIGYMGGRNPDLKGPKALPEKKTGKKTESIR